MRRFVWALHDLGIRTLAAFALLGLALAAIDPALDANVLWIHGAPLPGLAVTCVVALFGVSTLLRRHASCAALSRLSGFALGLLCLVDAAAFVALVRTSAIHSPMLVSSSLVFGLALISWALLATRAPSASGRCPRPVLRLAGMATAVCVLAGAATWLHIRTLGETDYRRPADAAVVLGCAVRADGSPSPALRDRTRTACALFHEGLVETLVLSGGQGPDAPISEPACMREIALEAGVPATALVLDEQGINTDATLATAADLVDRHGWSRLLFVSHDYHLARIKLAARRRGLAVFTVPAHETVPWPRKPLVVAREIAAFGWYFLQL